MRKYRKVKLRKIKRSNKRKALRTNKKVVGKGNRRHVKQKLFDDYGYVCWLCGKEKPREKLTLHHIHQFCYTHTTTYDDSMILCESCHFGIVNRIKYNSKEYWKLMNEILEKKGRPKVE
jgi:5-methylcytosine-specific restriction endonuclease McrA